jgi:hypothetical protein
MFRTISKIENLDFPGVSSYLSRYKEFSELVSSLIRLLSMEELTVDKTGAAAAILDRYLHSFTKIDITGVVKS